ncbi:hypothetical protein TERTU_2094 [Teredinibacter turnerae T7901]|uniref:Uncharacterized protein n=1 Tax=Teredinibacter turnerae (strain ATCC 39867 / T7901) TaxID=377629 RepID=C5BIV5_TERTT|nr:hypothetical protein TERTU_2094 [Teredinibacter turnerae T7901]
MARPCRSGGFFHIAESSILPLPSIAPIFFASKMVAHSERIFSTAD